jgi:hypothetical protein
MDVIPPGGITRGGKANQAKSHALAHTDSQEQVDLPHPQEERRTTEMVQLDLFKR